MDIILIQSFCHTLTIVQLDREAARNTLQFFNYNLTMSKFEIKLCGKKQLF